MRHRRFATVYVRVCTVFFLSSSVLIRDGSDTIKQHGVCRVAAAKDPAKKRTSAVMVLEGSGPEMCSLTVNDAHGQPIHRCGCIGALKGFLGPYTASTRTIPDAVILPVCHKTTVLASRISKESAGRSRTYKDRYGGTRRLHGLHAGSCRI
ncbi:hypothetical protein DPMN_131906 [Dreissena polymorpha]|uniref:Secreted protein n=1 Tax=Dreissena polymorpha TaxID=45954 RepID=A0A9D4FVS8_DREPO|nr:hypothetical protein DPMN_131906 [Dreissena polymorpha]